MKQPLPKPDAILTHESDLDGLLSGLLLQQLAFHLFGEEVTLEAYHYNAWKQRDLKERSLWIADFSFEPRMDRTDYVVIDHHSTETVPKSAFFIHDVTKSAALLCYELCQEQGLGSPALDRLVHLNNVSDLFLELDPDFELATDYANLVKNYQFWNLHTLIGGKLERLLDHPLLEVMAVKRKVEDPLGLAWSRNNIQQLSREAGFVPTLIGNANSIVHQLLERGITPYPVLVTLYRRTNGVVIASMRSRNGEALKVAERLQGGGHANAAGATLPKTVRTIPDAVDYLKRVLSPQSSSPSHAPLQSLEHLFDKL